MKLSLILTGRNDNYGGYFNERASLTTKYNISQLKKNNIDYEVIFAITAGSQPKSGLEAQHEK